MIDNEQDRDAILTTTNDTDAIAAKAPPKQKGRMVATKPPKKATKQKVAKEKPTASEETVGEGKSIAPAATPPKKPRVASGPAKLTLAELAEGYVANLEAIGKSLGTQFSYAQDLKIAVAFFGPEHPVAEITAADIERFNASDEVMKTNKGRAKAKPTFLKTQRVLRLALDWAVSAGKIVVSPIEQKPRRRKAGGE